MLWGIIVELKLATIMPCFKKTTVISDFLAELYPKILPVATFLGQKTYLLGEKLTYQDFILYELIMHWDWLTEQNIYE